MLNSPIDLGLNLLGQQSGDHLIELLTTLPRSILELRLSEWSTSPQALAALLSNIPHLITLPPPGSISEVTEDLGGISAGEAVTEEDNLTGSTGPEPILDTDVVTATQGALAAHIGLFSGHDTPSETTPDLRRGVSL